MTLACRDEDPLTGSGRERPRIEFDDELALEHEEELVARLTMPGPIERSRPRVEDGYAVHHPDFGIRPRRRRAQRRRVGSQRGPQADLSAHARIVAQAWCASSPSMVARARA